MSRRRFLLQAASGAVLSGAAAAGGFFLGRQNSGAVAQAAPQPAAPAVIRKRYEWRMATTWPKGFPGIGAGAEHLAKLIDEYSEGRLKVQVFGAGEIAPSFEILEAVSEGRAEMGHGAAYYWQDRVPGATFFTTVPYGLNAQEMNAWLYHGGGMALWEELYGRLNLLPNAAGNTGVQLGGWFMSPVETPADFRGLRMRIPGFAQRVLERFGGVPVSLPGGRILSALRDGDVDAVEWVGPYNDLLLGLHKVARYAYYPGWHEPGTCIECFINRDAMIGLPADLQSIVKHACRAANYEMLSRFTALNGQALEELENEHKVEFRRFSDEILSSVAETSDEVVREFASRDELSQRIFDSYVTFRGRVARWHAISEAPFYRGRRL